MATDISKILKRVKEKVGDAITVTQLGDLETPYDVRIPFGLLELDMALAGGWPCGTINQLFAADGCLAADTHVNYEVRDQAGNTRHNCRGGTIERLYERFNNVRVRRNGKGCWQRPHTAQALFFAASVNEEGRIVQNKIEEVVSTGSKPCVRISTRGGSSIVATGDHKFFDGEKYVAASELSPGSVVFVHNKTPYRVADAARVRRKERTQVYVKHHPYAAVKNVTGTYKGKKTVYPYHRLSRTRVVVEAALNNLSVEDYTALLNCDTVTFAGMQFVLPGQVVHHLNENSADDRRENLVVLTKLAHDQHHAHERHNDLRFAAVPDIVASVEDAGMHETYDVRMASPHNNYVANKFVVHNSGKNLLVNHNIAQVQKIYGDGANILYLSFGYKPDIGLMRKCGVQVSHSDQELRKIGIDPATATAEQRGTQLGNLVFVDISGDKLAEEQPAEALLTAAHTFIESCQFQLVVIDEMASGETGDNVIKGLHETSKIATWASLVTNFTKKVYSALRKHDADGHPNATCIVVLQPVRANMDAFTAKFTPFTIPSGHALKHAKAVDLHLRVGAPIQVKPKGKVGKKIHWKVSKGKFGLGEGAEGELDFYYFDESGAGGIDTVPGLVNVAKAHGTVVRKGNKYFILDYEDAIEGGLESVVATVKKDPALAEELYKETVKLALTGEVR